MANRIGHMLGGYRLVRLLGEGGYSEVYLARNIHIKHYAAIKILKARLNPSELQQFRNEAQIITNLKHQHIIQIHHFNVENHTPFLIMDYASHGTMLRRHPYGSRVPLDAIVVYVKQIADALHYIHEQQLVHRDIKPQNILLGPNNELLLGDFGVAIITQSTSKQTTQSYRGTAAYAAPEQFSGHPRPASDQYSLAVLVYEWLCGKLPFEGSFEELYHKHLHEPPPPLRPYYPDIPPTVEHVVLKALNKDRHQRFPSIQAFADALEHAYLSSQHSVSGTFTHPQPDAPPHPTQPIHHQLSQPPTQPPPIHHPAHSFSFGIPLCTYQGHAGAVRAIAWSHDGKLIASGGDDETVQVWEALHGNTISTYDAHTFWIHSISWSLDGKHIASVSGNKEIHISNSLTGYKDFVCHSTSALVITVAWSPKDNLIATGTNDGFVHLWDVLSRRELLSYHGHSGRVEALTWSPNGTFLASASTDSTVHVWNVSTGKNVLTYSGHSSSVYAISWSPDSKLLASTDRDGMVRIWNAATGADVQTYDEHSGIVYAVSWSDDSKHIASGGEDKVVQVWNVLTGATLYTFREHSGAIHDIAWSPKEKLIASASDDGTIQVWEAS